MDVYSPEKRSAVMARVRAVNTKPELVVRRRLHALGFRFRLHARDLPGTPDIVLPRYRSVIFVHGCFWHGHTACPKAKLPSSNTQFWTKKIARNVERDKDACSVLKRNGWRVFLIWECGLANKRSFEQLVKSLLMESTAKPTRKPKRSPR
jgi:DNA mismatch endonuclease, patch repair protein